MISENWGVLKGFCRFHVIYESFGEQNTGSQCLKRNLIQNISMDKSVILLFLMLSLTLLHFFSLTPLSFAHLRSHTDIYFYREALPGTHSPVRSTCLMFILLLNHQSISIGCWAVSLEQIRVKHPARSQIDRKLFADDHALVTSKFLYIFEQHHPLVKALASSHTQWDDGEVIHAALQGHHPHPECFMYLLSGCTVTERLPHLINIHVLI